MRSKLFRHGHLIGEVILRLPLEGILSKAGCAIVSQQVVRRCSISLVRKPLYPARAVPLGHAVVPEHIPVCLPCHY